ncbi:hypothetical protein FEM48_Zijuj08G0171400 [Ziziphus jujuba var. spinosa]|uniref:Late embryogenesis abundant protein LEA-2 subgroup domain-containing protein n=1 Tax=Ziziphus jujuba var. spinosa TaxID=714518 RepID=A0A978V0B9_ZIZJJ|nr:hypothetical protein FEM48_Zijuj08G0171400 [Ziziphus jujuba var. spinosa]
MASSSKSEALAHHEEGAKNPEKKQFTSQTWYKASLVVAIVVVMCVAMGTIWAVVQPRRPKVVVEDGYFTNASLSYYNTTLSGKLYFSISFYNPNKKATIYVDSLSAAPSFGDNISGPARLNSTVSLPPDRHLPLNFTYPIALWSMYGYMPKYQNQGRIVQSISLQAKIRFGLAKWKSHPRTLNIYCSPLKVFTTVSGTSTFRTTVCEYHDHEEHHQDGSGDEQIWDIHALTPPHPPLPPPPEANNHHGRKEKFGKQAVTSMSREFSALALAGSAIVFNLCRLMQLNQEGVLVYWLDSKLSKNIPPDFETLRSKVASDALRFAAPIRELGNQFGKRMWIEGPYIDSNPLKQPPLETSSGCHIEIFFFFFFWELHRNN